MINRLESSLRIYPGNRCGEIQRGFMIEFYSVRDTSAVYVGFFKTLRDSKMEIGLQDKEKGKTF